MAGLDFIQRSDKRCECRMLFLQSRFRRVSAAAKILDWRAGRVQGDEAQRPMHNSEFDREAEDPSI
jgi:hypothetical protein